MQTSTHSLTNNRAIEQTLKVHLSIKANMLLLITNIKIEVDFRLCVWGRRGRRIAIPISTFRGRENEPKIVPNRKKCQKIYKLRIARILLPFFHHLFFNDIEL